MVRTKQGAKRGEKEANSEEPIHVSEETEMPAQKAPKAPPRTKKVAARAKRMVPVAEEPELSEEDSSEGEEEANTVPKKAAKPAAKPAVKPAASSKMADAGSKTAVKASKPAPAPLSQDLFGEESEEEPPTPKKVTKPAALKNKMAAGGQSLAKSGRQPVFSSPEETEGSEEDSSEEEEIEEEEVEVEETPELVANMAAGKETAKTTTSLTTSTPKAVENSEDESEEEEEEEQEASPKSIPVVSAPKKKASSNVTAMTQKTGISFPVLRIRKYLLKGNYAQRVSREAAVYMAAVLEYMCAEILELSGNFCRSSKRIRIIPRHIMLAIQTDEELYRFLGDVWIASAGRKVEILEALQPKKKGKKQQQQQQ